MQSVLVIFNGIRFPYYLMEFSLQQAKAHSASLHGLFLKAEEESREGYGFPSDLAEAESLTDAEDARKDDEAIIRDQMKLSADMAATENIPYTMERMTGSSLEEVLRVVDRFDLVYLDAAFDDDTPAMLTNNSFTLKELTEQASVPVEVVSGDDA